jgi:hypothetical protein
MLIPQTPQQALERDHLAGRADTPRPASPATEVSRLRNAILEHQDTVEAAGTLGPVGKFTSEQRGTMKAKHDADRKLWAHLQPANTDDTSETTGP